MREQADATKSTYIHIHIRLAAHKRAQPRPNTAQIHNCRTLLRPYYCAAQPRAVPDEL